MELNHLVQPQTRGISVDDIDSLFSLRRLVYPQSVPRQQIQLFLQLSFLRPVPRIQAMRRTKIRRNMVSRQISQKLCFLRDEGGGGYRTGTMRSPGYVRLEQQRRTASA